MLDVRRRTMGFVSQFLRVIPRVATVDVVAEPLLRLGADPAEARDRAEFLLALLNIPQRLWHAAARHLLGRRAAARQHRPLADRRLPDPAARRADGLARRRQPRPRGRVDPGSAATPAAALVGIFHDVGVRELSSQSASRRSSHEQLPKAANEIFTNARVVTRRCGVRRHRRGARRADRRGRRRPRRLPAALDLEGDYLVPGLVELHTDNMEKHFAPRPGVQWPVPGRAWRTTRRSPPPASPPCSIRCRWATCAATPTACRTAPAWSRRSARRATGACRALSIACTCAARSRPTMPSRPSTAGSTCRWSA